MHFTNFYKNMYRLIFNLISWETFGWEMSVMTFRGPKQPKSILFLSKILIYVWIFMFDPSKCSSWQTTLIFDAKQPSFDWKSLTNNFGFLKNSHRPLEIGTIAHRPQHFFLNVSNRLFANFRKRNSFLGPFQSPICALSRKNNRRGGDCSTAK